MGTAEQLAQLRQELEKGPMMARVEGISEEPATLDMLYSSEFSIECTI